MKNALVLATLGMVLLGSFMQSASAQVKVFVGYLDTIHGGDPDHDEIPTPFDEDETTTLIGLGNGHGTHDTGVILFENFSDASVTIDLVRVVTEGEGPADLCAANVFKVWDDDLPFTLEPGKNLVLAETENFNFDSSDCGLGLDPVVIFKINGGPQFTCVDQSRVLLGKEEAGEQNKNETTQYQLLLCTQSAGRPRDLPKNNH